MHKPHLLVLLLAPIAHVLMLHIHHHDRSEVPCCAAMQVLQFTKVTFGYSPDKILYSDIDFGVDLVRITNSVALSHPTAAVKPANIEPNIYNTVYAVGRCSHLLYD